MEVKIIRPLVIFTVTIFFISQVNGQAPKSLRLVQLMYRHGDRSPTETFPTDPYQEDAWPQGFGQLSKVGMQQHYQLGKYFRKRYNGFLNESYSRYEIHVRSTDKDRTLMSAASNLAGLYPPEGEQVWNPDIPWQPIPIHTKPYDDDPLLHTTVKCQAYDKEVNQLKKSEVYQNFVKLNKEWMEKVAKYAGMPDASLDSIWDVYDALFVEKFNNLTLPDWVTEEMFERLASVSTKSLEFWFYYPEMTRLRAGLFLAEIVNHTEYKAQGKMDSRMKMYMYSAHDSTIGALLFGIHNWNWIKPPYCATIMFELHENPVGQFYVNILYRNDTEAEPYRLSLPGCEFDCPVDKFSKILQPMLIKGGEKAWYEECDQAPHPIPSSVVIVVVVACLLFLVIVVGLIVCYRKRQVSGIRYQAANFSLPPDA